MLVMRHIKDLIPAVLAEIEKKRPTGMNTVGNTTHAGEDSVRLSGAGEIQNHAGALKVAQTKSPMAMEPIKR